MAIDSIEKEVEPGCTRKEQGGAPKCVASFTMKPRTVQNHIVGNLTPAGVEVSACIKQTEKALGNRFESPVHTFCGRFIRLVLESQPAL